MEKDLREQPEQRRRVGRRPIPVRNQWRANSVAVIHLAHGGDEESAGGSGGRSELTG